jgi:dephospho-CoA kinase
MRVFRLGLTGSIGMGKSATARLFADQGLPVWDADQAVHRLYAPGGLAVGPVSKLVPEAEKYGSIDRSVLKQWLLNRPEAMAELEAVVHPLVASDRAAFLEKANADIVVLDIPLLFERGIEQEMDAVLVVTAPAELQRARVLSRSGMNERQFLDILARQLPDREKRARADHIIETLSEAAAFHAVEALVRYIRSKAHA